MEKTGDDMKFRRVLAFVCMILVVTLSLSSCLLVEEAIFSPYEETSPTETLVEVKDSTSSNKNVDWLLTVERLDVAAGERITLKLPPNGRVSSVLGTLYFGKAFFVPGRLEYFAVYRLLISKVFVY